MEENPEILKITVDISENNQGTIRLHQNDDPGQIATNFICEHHLDISIYDNLVNIIKSQQQLYNKSRKSSGPKSSSPSIKSKASSLSALTDRIMKHSYRYSESSRRTHNFNYGQLLYEKGLEMKTSQRAESEKKLLEKENLSKSHTFRPALNKNSVEIAKSYNKETRIKRSQDLIEKLKSTKQEQEMKECYFVPMISERCSKHARKNVFQELYQEGIEKIKDSKETKLNKSKVSLKVNEEVDHIVERLYNSKQKTDAEVDKLRNDIYSDYDKITGQKLFVPVTGAKQQVFKSERNIWEELYYIRKQNRRENTENDKIVVHTIDKSEKLFEKVKKNRFEEIFKKLDSDNDGKISADAICLDEFDRESILIMAPVLEEIDKNRKDFEIAEFVQMMEGLYARLGTQAKMLILKNEHEKEKLEFTFKPTINKRSKKLASNPHLGENIFDRTQAARDIKEMKIKKMKEMKEKERNESKGRKNK